jgi:hypothetical protein
VGVLSHGMLTEQRAKRGRGVVTERRVRRVGVLAHGFATRFPSEFARPRHTRGVGEYAHPTDPTRAGVWPRALLTPRPALTLKMLFTAVGMV